MAITRATEVRHLPQAAKQYIADVLDQNDKWIELAESIRLSGNEIGYKMEHIMAFATRSRRSPTLMVLEDWGTRRRIRPTVGELLQSLVAIRQYRAADYIAEELLKEDPVPRDHVITLREEVNISSGAFGPFPSLSETIGKPVSGTDSGARPNGAVHGACYVDPLNLKKEICKSIEALEDGRNNGVPLPHIDYVHVQEGSRNFNEDMKLGQGGFGSVFLGSLTINCEQKAVAIKRLNVGEDEQFQTELLVMRSFVHENLLPILAFSCDNPKARCLICAYMENGSLEDRLAQKRSTPPLSWNVRVQIAVGVARGLVALHTAKPENLIHRDIKSANILLDLNFVAKIGDFGVARLVRRNWSDTTVLMTSKWCGTPVYLADEALKGIISVKMDAYSFGIVLLELLTGLPPYDSAREYMEDLLTFVNEQKRDAWDWKDLGAGEWPRHVTEGLFDVAKKCSKKNRQDRAYVADVLPDLEALSAD